MPSCKLKSLINFYILSPQAQEIEEKRIKTFENLRKIFEKSSKKSEGKELYKKWKLLKNFLVET